MSDRIRPILTHRSFFESYDEISESSTRKIEKEVANELEKVSTQPHPPGKIHFSLPELEDKIYHFDIGGRGGYRAFWILEKIDNYEICILFYIKEAKRKDFKYDKDLKIKLNKIGVKILDAFNSEKLEEFEEWIPEGEYIKRKVFK